MVAASATKGSEPPSLRYSTRNETGKRLNRLSRVKNNNPAPIQITAEQILREARDLREGEQNRLRSPRWKITDSAELDDYRRQKRNQFENLVRRVGQENTSSWVRYARWEESQKDFHRARSVWERALDAPRLDHSLYLKYAEFEMKNKFVNHARNVLERAVALFPRVDQLWHEYIHMEEMLGNGAGARKISERWMRWQPEI